MTDKKLFDSFAKLIPGFNMITGNYDNTTIWMHTDSGSMELIHDGKIKIEWSTTSKEYPPPKNQLEPCKYCEMDMIIKLNNEGKPTGILMHPVNSDCPWSRMEAIKNRWPTK